MITVDELGVVRGGRALLRGVSLRVAAGELLAIVGPNGAGKSTLLGAIAGDVPIACGTIAIAGVPIAGAPAAQLARLRAVLPQASGLTAPLTAREVVELGDVTAGTGAARRARSLRCLAEVELAAHAERSYATLSGGERQRVHVARALAQLDDAGPRALLLDEPTAALDLRHQHVVLGRARAAAARGHAVLAVLHDLNLAARYADRIALVDRGAIAAIGSPARVLAPDVLAPVFAVGFRRLDDGAGSLIATEPS